MYNKIWKEKKIQKTETIMGIKASEFIVNRSSSYSRPNWDLCSQKRSNFVNFRATIKICVQACTLDIENRSLLTCYVVTISSNAVKRKKHRATRCVAVVTAHNLINILQAWWFNFGLPNCCMANVPIEWIQLQNIGGIRRFWKGRSNYKRE